MQRLWFITNPHSGSSDAAKAEAILAAFAERGLTLAGRTDFPDDDLPTPGALAKAKADTVVLFAGDGTINAAVCALADWDGAILVLPGRHDEHARQVAPRRRRSRGDHRRRARDGRRIALPFVEAGKHRALVGLIVGPAANWYRAREAYPRTQARRLVAGGADGVAAHVRQGHPAGRRAGFPAASAGRLCPRRTATGWR